LENSYLKKLFLIDGFGAIISVYDFYCYFNIERNLEQFLKIIAIINLLYCCLSIGFAFYHYQQITYLGWSYIIVEISIVVALAVIELRAGKGYSQK